MVTGEQGVDPSSQLYYTAIESHVAAAFPGKWAHWQQLAAAADIRTGESDATVAWPTWYPCSTLCSAF